MKFLLLIFSAFFLYSSATEEPMCCVKCTKENEIKYYSIDHIWNRCGECCMDPAKYWIYKIFEPGLTEAKEEHPCESKGYSVYEKTETHGAMGIYMTLDKYKKPE